MSKVAVLLCRCFGEVDGVIDLEALRRKAEENDSVVSSTISDSLCLKEDMEKTAALIRDCGAEKVVIGGCSSLARGGAVVDAMVCEGIKRSHAGLVDLREGCAWIHGDDPQGATLKAWNLVQMEIAAMRYRKASDDVTVKVCPEAMIVGAGPAGLSAACALSRLGFSVHLLERGSSPGGMLNLISHVYPSDEKAGDKIKAYSEEVEKNPLISFYPKAKILSVRGFAGDFKVHISSSAGEKKLRVGAVILASGARIWLPHGLYRYGKLKQVITQMELERQFLRDSAPVKTAVFIQCVGARNHERPYCAAMCCPSSLKNAARIRDENPDARVFILHRDIMTPGSVLEAYYRKALAKGVQFIRFEETNPPEILGEERAEGVEVFDIINGMKRKIDTDLVVLSTPLVPNDDNAKLAGMLGLELDRYGFFPEIYPLHPLETRMDGVFICGSARWPVSSGQAMMQGEGAAVKAASLLGREAVSALSLSRVPGEKFGHASVNAEACTGCGNCVAVCPFEACRLQKTGRKSVSRVNKLRCKACGNCVSACPNGTIQLPEHDYRAVGAMIKTAFAGERFK
ncbi:MAG: FAD-dependent oxidoreductase [Deltaproteobacteria bacterium]|nr:FAD-dependent oxidoreductase [Deltaproteobacteria bacterium]